MHCTRPRALALALMLLAAGSPPALAADTGGVRAPSLQAPAPGAVATLDRFGMAHAPAAAPRAVKAAIRAGNELQGKPYVWGGGHGSWKSRGYDCSGTVSYVLHAAGLLGTPMASGPLMRYGLRGEGRWVTIRANSGHAFVYLAGLRLDTSGSGGRGPRWRAEPRSTAGFVARHPVGL